MPARRGMQADKQAVQENPLVVFMKGTPDAPQCGFSRAVIQILDVQVSAFLAFSFFPGLTAGRAPGEGAVLQLPRGPRAARGHQGVQVSWAVVDEAGRGG